MPFWLLSDYFWDQIVIVHAIISTPLDVVQKEPFISLSSFDLFQESSVFTKNDFSAFQGFLFRLNDQRAWYTDHLSPSSE